LPVVFTVAEYGLIDGFAHVIIYGDLDSIISTR
jgi:hypothetical protein